MKTSIGRLKLLAGLVFLYGLFFLNFPEKILAVDIYPLEGAEIIAGQTVSQTENLPDLPTGSGVPVKVKRDDTTQKSSTGQTPSAALPAAQQSTPSLAIVSSTPTSVTFSVTFPTSGIWGNAIVMDRFDGAEANYGTGPYDGNWYKNNGTYTITGLTPGGFYDIWMWWSADGTWTGHPNRIYRKVQLPYNTAEALIRTDGTYVFTNIEVADKNYASSSHFNRWLGHLDTAYLALQDLVGRVPYSGAKIELKSTRTDLDTGNPDGGNIAWHTQGTAGNPVLLWQPFMRSQMMRLSSDDWSQHALWTLSADFDSSAWMVDAWFFGWFKQYYVIETTGGKVYEYGPNKYYTGSQYVNYFKTDRYSESYDATFANGNYSSCGLTYVFIRIKNTIGWQPFKETFRYFNTLPSNQVPASNIGKFNLFITKLQDYSGYNILSLMTGSEKTIIGNRLGGAVGIVENGGISSNPSQAAVQDPSAIRDSQRYYGDPIDTATGAHVLDQPLLTLQGAQSFSFALHYNSLLLKAGPFGKGWESNYQASLETQSGGDIVIRWSANRYNTFAFNGSSYVPRDRAVQYDKLIRNTDGSYILTRKDQSLYHFNSSGKLTQLGNGHGQHLNLVYDGSGRLQRVTEPVSGKFFTLAYNAAGLVQSVTDSGNRKVTFTYDGNGNLLSIAKPIGTITYTYDSLGRVLTGTNPAGVQAFSNTYDAGRITRQLDAENRVTTLTYDEASQSGFLLTTITDRNGKKLVYKYDAAYNLLRITNALNQVTQYTYDGKGNKTGETDANGHTTTYTYDSQGNLLTVKDAQGHTTTMTYDGNNNLLTMTNAAGKALAFTYDSRNNLTSQTDPLNHTTAYTYNNNGLMESKTTPNSGQNVYHYTSGLVQSVTDAAGNTVAYEYDAFGRQVRQTNPDGGQSLTAYNAADQITGFTDPLGHTASWTYDANGNQLTATDPKGNTTTYAYDAEGNLTGVTDPLNQLTSYQYDNENRLTKLTNALGYAMTYQYDAAGRRISTTDPLGNTVQTQYDAVGNITRITDALNVRILTIAYDTLNNPVTQTDSLGNRTTSQYDNLNRLTAVIDPLNHTTRFQYDASNSLTGSTDPGQGSGSQEFDANGNRIALIDANGNRLTFAYDALDRLTALTDAAGGSTTYQYNANSLITRMTNGRGQNTDYQYDLNGRVTQASDPAGIITYTYDNNGNLLTLSDPAGTLTWTYDALNRPLSYTDGYGNLLQYGYDAVGNLTTLTYPDGRAVHYAYDQANRLIRATDWNQKITSYTYDANNRLKTTTRPDGSVETRTYDSQGRLTEINDLDKNGVVLNHWTTVYDGAGNVLTEKNSADTMATPSGDTVTMTYGAANRLATYNGQPVSYDADGNMITGPLGSNPAAHFSYDARSRLTAAGGLSYTYDALDNRIEITDAQGQVKRLVVNPNALLSQVLMETDDQGNVVRYYIYGLGLIGSQDTSGGYSLHHYNRRGDTIALTDLNGQVTDRMVYDPYGAVISRIGTTQTPYLFDGRDGVATDDNGLVHMRARYYNPQTGGFISQDTLLGSITHTKSLNRYAYAEGNPLIYVDPSGHFIGTVTGGVIGGIIGGVSAALNHTDIATGIVSWAVSGAIVGVATDFTIATLGTGIAAVGVVGAAGGVGGAVGEIISQVGNRAGGISATEAIQNLDKKAIAVSTTGIVAGALTGGTSALLKAGHQTSVELYKSTLLNTGAIGGTGKALIQSSKNAFKIDTAASTLYSGSTTLMNSIINANKQAQMNPVFNTTSKYK